MNCITKSAAIAPGAPRRLWMRALVAWLRLGSLTDQVKSARQRQATPASAPKPAISAARRFGKSRTEAGTWSINENVVVRIADSPDRRGVIARRVVPDPKRVQLMQA